MTEPFRERLVAAIEARGPLCAGIDPSASMLERCGLEDSASGARAFAARCLDAFSDHASVLKPNVAFFEQYGAAGLAALESFVNDARDAGVLVLVDAKRGDIGSTNAAYARAWLDDASPAPADALTVAPYLGPRALSPFFDAARSSGRGVFVVARSSNPEGRAVQCCRGEDGRRLEEAVLDEVAREPQVVGAVVGVLAGAAPLEVPGQGFYLVPGLWSQGASLDDLAAQSASMRGAAVVVNVSRALFDAGTDRPALRDSAARASGEIAARLRPPQD